jgi:hypothetical protein
MFIVEGRTLGVFAALGVLLSMVELDRLTDVADSTEPRSLSAFTTGIATPLPAMRHDGELAPPCNGVGIASAASILPAPGRPMTLPAADERHADDIAFWNGPGGQRWLICIVTTTNP